VSAAHGVEQIAANPTGEGHPHHITMSQAPTELTATLGLVAHRGRTTAILTSLT
jgi:hypothetical protein